MALVLSHNRGIDLMRMPKSSSCCFIQRSCVQQLPAATYSASAVDKATEFCFLDDHDIKHPARN